MARRWLIALALLVVAASLVGGLVVVIRAQSADDPSTRPPATSPPPATADPGSSAVSPTPTASRPGPPADSGRVDDRYRARYAGRYVGWDDLLASGKKLPPVSAGCRSEWKTTTRDAALDWRKARYLCLDQLVGNGFRPQGIGGTGAARDYLIGDRPAADRNIVVISSYARAEAKGVAFPNKTGTTEATRLTVIDVDRRVYQQVELVRPIGTNAFTALDSHGSGFVWAGQYLYSSSLGHLWMYNADDLMEINGHFVLPAVGHWKTQGSGGLSSISIDPTRSPATLTGVNFNQHGTAWSQSFHLDREGRLQRASTVAAQPLKLISDYGPGPATVVSARSSVVPGSNFQGIGTSGHYSFLNSSSLMLNGRRYGDHLVIMKKSKAIARFSMPTENLESVYVDYRRGRYVTITEYGRQFLFWLPLDHLIDRAER